MERTGTKRKLAAILMADVVGYSRLMGDDEAATVRTLKAYRKLFANQIASHDGRVVNTPGDSILAEFGSVVDAVACAAEIQRELAEKNRELPASRAMAFRIGINLGDVVVEEEAIYGDGVNVAARLESLADPGGIAISGMAYESVKGKLDLEFEFLGRKEVKNIAEPVPAFRVLSHPGAAAHRVTRAKRSLSRSWRRAVLIAGAAAAVAVVAAVAWEIGRQAEHTEPGATAESGVSIPEKPSIAVLPFVNMSGDPDMEPFSDGVTEDIITALSQYRQLSVVAKNSSFQYKGKFPDVRKVGEDLGVSYVLEGSVRISEEGDRVRITAQLVDTASGNHLWAERYDRPLKDMFALQDEITDRIAVALDVALLEGEQSATRRKATQSKAAFDFFRRGNEFFELRTPEGNVKSIQLIEQALAIDPQFSSAWGHLGYNHFYDAKYGWTDSPDNSLAMAQETVNKGLEIDPAELISLMVVGELYRIRGEYDEAIEQFKKMASAAPNNLDVVYQVPAMLMYAGRYEESLAQFERATRIGSAVNAYFFSSWGQSYLRLGRYSEAIEQLRISSGMAPHYLAPHLWLAVAHAESGDLDGARAEVADIRRLDPEFSLENLPLDYVMHRKPLDRYFDGLRRAGLN